MVQDDSPCLLEIVREDKEMTVEITPALDRRDGSHRLGMWVRDSTAGIGTLSFYDPESGVFGAQMQVTLTNDGPFTIYLECRNGEILA
jgi:stage IV sporulation protein B